MENNQDYLNERDLWKIVYAPGIRGWRERYLLSRQFMRHYRRGHRESIRPLVERVEERVLAGEIFRGTQNFLIRQIHPRAFRLLVEYGHDYRPQPVWKHTPGMWEDQPRDGMCQIDSWEKMSVANSCFSVKPHMVYVEGITVGVEVPFMLHAWNARGLESRKAIDWNHYTRGRWSRYLGIPFTQSEHEKILDLSEIRDRRHHLLFQGKFFEKAELYISELLAGRI
jgi:hypothetical protein